MSRLTLIRIASGMRKVTKRSGDRESPWRIPCLLIIRSDINTTVSGVGVGAAQHPT